MAPELDLELRVVGLVADLEHGFREALGYIRRIKERKKARAPPNRVLLDAKLIQDLEFSLARGGNVIHTHYERDFRRLGQLYAAGDDESSHNLNAVYLKLQRTVVDNLRNAYHHDEDVDLIELQDASDESQDCALMCLMQLHQRLLTTIHLNDLAMGKPYAKTTQAASQIRNAPRSAALSSPRPVIKPQLSDAVMTTEQLKFAVQRNTPPSPEISPPPGQTSFRSPGLAQTRAHPLPVATDDRQPTLPTLPALPTPPAEAAPMSPVAVPMSPAGPPPSSPLPPAPMLPSRVRRRDGTPKTHGSANYNVQLTEAEEESGRTFLDRTFANQGLPRGQRYATAQYHDHRGVQTSLQNPINEHATWSRPGTAQGFGAESVADLHSTSHATASPETAQYGRSEGHDAANGFASRPDRASVTSGSTSGSYYSNTSATSHTPSTPTSSASFVDLPSVPAIPVGATRGKLQKRAPAPVRESSSLSTIRTMTPGQQRDEEHANFSAAPMAQIPAFAAPALPVEVAQPNGERRESTVSQQSGSSSLVTVPALPPVRTISPLITDASDSKLYLPSDKNSYAGLCKGSWRAQIGDTKKAYQSQSRPGGMASMIELMKCRSCEFSGKLVLNAKGKKGPDRKIIVARGTGLAYRWDFLFKSHLSMKGGSPADAEFGCMFCCAEGKGTPVFKGMNAFIAHVAEHRPGAAGNGNSFQIPDPIVSDRMEAAIGRNISVEERYEVALPAVNPQAHLAASHQALSPATTPHF